MPFDRLFRQEAKEEDALLDVYFDEVRQQIVSLREELELFETPAWKHVDQRLAQKLERAFRDMMVGEPEQMILARERARVVSDLREEPNLIREKIAGLEKELQQLEGE